MENEQVQPASASALHVSRDLVLDLIRAGQGGFDLVDAFIIFAVRQANIRTVVDRFDEQMRYSSLDAAPPDSLRTPISISRVAQSLHLPFETVRRRVNALQTQGVCEVHPMGLVIPTAFFESQEQRTIILESDRIAARIYARLEAAGFFDAHPLPAPAVEVTDAPTRAVARLEAGYVLRTLYVLRDVGGDYLNAVLLMQMTRLNTAHIGDDRERLAARRHDPIVPDDMKRPASVMSIATELGLGFETARRRLARLAAAGACVHAKDGYIVPAEAFRPISPDLARTNDANLWRFYRACAQVGAVQAWTRQRSRLGAEAQAGRD